MATNTITEITAGTASHLVCEQFYLDCLSQASYLIGDTSTGRAVVVDPRRDIQVYLDAAAERSMTIEMVLETHFHADFLSGHLELAKATGATIGYGSKAQPEFPARMLDDGERISLGQVTLEIRHTPGHTPESISIVVHETPDSTEPYAVLTGDTMFIGDVGRPDLLVSIGFTSDELGKMLYSSLHDKLLTLPDTTRVLPAHGAGSACGKNLSTETMSTIGEQRRTNYALLLPDVETFVDVVTEGQPTAPGYFVYDAVRNRQERDVLDEHVAPERLGVDEVLRLAREGVAVVDTREAPMFAAGHLVGSVNVGLQGRYAEYAGAVVTPETDVVIVTEAGSELEAKIRLARIGYDRVRGWLCVDDLADRPEVVRFASRLDKQRLESARRDVPGLQLVDVRNTGEHALGALSGAVHIPVAELTRRMGELDRSVPTVVYCAGGYRSSLAASVLRAAGFEDVSDVLGGYEAVKN
jgi:hydroxyacylglutathione hydrolase